MSRVGKQFNVDTHPTKDVVVNGLTRDATVEACVFDLIDNSIDAARDTIFQSMPKKARDEVPDNYSKYRIDISLNGTEFRIEDNCGGIPVEKLKKLVLRFGERSAHPMGIGAFGVGLNRALFKLGKISHLMTDTGKQRAELILNTDEYLERKEWELPAVEFNTSGRIGTEIQIRSLPNDIARDFADKDWEKKLRHSIGRRYGRFIAKKLAITVNGTLIKNEEVQLRQNGPLEYQGEHKFYKTKDGVAIHVEYGQHKDHRFSNESDYDQDRNSRITDQFGWTVLCNERAILFSDQTRKTGWDTKLHSEHYGFVGIVNFISQDPSRLPWNTTKTDVDLNNDAYGLALKDMRKFAEKWRAVADKRKKALTAPHRIPPKKTTSSGPSRRPPPKKPLLQAKPEPVTKVDHNEFRTVLPDDINEQFCNDKHLALVHEAKELDLVDFTYSGLALIRMLFETSAVTFLDRHGRYGDLVSYSIEKTEKKISRKYTDDERKRFAPKIDDMLPFFQSHPELWTPAKATHLRHSLSNLGKHQSRLNSALHNPFQAINKTEAFVIRDEVLPILRHLIET